MIITLVIQNMDKELPGDAELLAHLRTLIPGEGLIALQEARTAEHGADTVRLIAVGGLKIHQRERKEIGKVGVHNGLIEALVELDDQRLWVVNHHGLHRRTQGQAAQDTYYAQLERLIRGFDRRGDLWVDLADFNRLVTAVAKLLGGTAHGIGVDGAVVSDGITVVHEHADYYGKAHHLSDHLGYVIVIKITAHTAKEHR